MKLETSPPDIVTGRRKAVSQLGIRRLPFVSLQLSPLP